MLWAGIPLKQRCVLSHRQFQNHRINPTLLRKFYHEYKIRSKKVKLVKRIDPAKEPGYEEWRLDLKTRFADLKSKHYQIIYLY